MLILARWRRVAEGQVSSATMFRSPSTLKTIMPRLLNYVVAIYLILVGFIGLNSLFHFVR
jgi:hypothetical protein